MSRLFPRLALGALYLAAFVLCLKALREPDLWWMLRTGEYIWAEGAVPATDPFSYTFPEQTWINVKWLFELLLAGLSALGGVELIFVWQGLVALGILELSRRHGEGLRREAGQASGWGLMMLFLAIVGMDFRWIGRPEMHSHLFTAAYLLLFSSYARGLLGRGVWLLPLLQVLWTNLHEGFGTGPVLMLAFGAFYGLEYAWRRKTAAPALPKPWPLYGAIALALLLLPLHPWGWRMWLHPLEIFGQLGLNKYTQELRSFRDPYYWTWEAWLSMGLAFSALASFIWRSWQARRSGQTWPEALSRYGLLAQWGLVAMLFYLSLTAHRNLPFFFIAVLPPLYAFFQDLACRRPRLSQLAWGLALLLGLGLYLGTVSQQYREWTKGRDVFGLQILNGHNPVGAAEFLAEHQLQGKKAFTDYLVSAYLLHRLQPAFKTYIDLRDLDIFSDEFFQQFVQMSLEPQGFDREDSLRQFDYVVLLRPQFTALHAHIFNRPDYDLVFVDAVAAVYLKAKPEHQALIAAKGFKARQKEDFSPLKPNQSGALAAMLNQIFRPGFKNEDYLSQNQDLFAAAFFQNLGQLDWALARAEAAAKHPLAPKPLFLADLYNLLAFERPDLEASLRESYKNQALNLYQQALRQDANNLEAGMGLALWHFRQQQFGEATTILNRLLKKYPQDFALHEMLAVCYKFIANNEANPQISLSRQLKHLETMDALQPQNPRLHFELGLAHCRLSNCAKSKPYLEQLRAFPGLNPDERNLLEQCLNRCR